MDCTVHIQMPINLNLKSQLFAENGKIQLTPKITKHLFTCYLNCMCKSNPVCLIQQWSVVILLGSYVQWHYFLVWHAKIDPLTFSHLCSLWKGMQLSVSFLWIFDYLGNKVNRKPPWGEVSFRSKCSALQNSRIKVRLSISRTNADSHWNPVYNAFHRIFCCGNETIRR